MFFLGVVQRFFICQAMLGSVVCALAYMAVYTLLKKYGLFCSIKLLCYKNSILLFFLSGIFFYAPSEFAYEIT